MDSGRRDNGSVQALCGGCGGGGGEEKEGRERGEMRGMVEAGRLSKGSMEPRTQGAGRGGGGGGLPADL